MSNGSEDVGLPALFVKMTAVKGHKCGTRPRHYGMNWTYGIIRLLIKYIIQQVSNRVGITTMQSRKSHCSVSDPSSHYDQLHGTAPRSETPHGAAPRQHVRPWPVPHSPLQTRDRPPIFISGSWQPYTTLYLNLNQEGFKLLNVWLQ